MTDISQDNTLDEALARARSNWGWFVALGALVVFLGTFALAHAVIATVASIFMIGVLMIAGGIAHIVAAFRGRSWKRFLLWLAGGVLYLLAGAAVFANPALASSLLTLVIAFALLAAGVARIWFGFAARPADGWGWIVAAGIITLLLGLIIATGWPVNSLWIIGMFLGIDLIFQGWSYIALGLALRSRT